MAYLDGRPITVDEALALGLTGLGHFTSMRADDGRVRGLGLHMERLRRDCLSVFGVTLDTDKVLDDVRAATAHLAGSFTIRVTVFDPAIGLGNVSADSRPSVLVTVRPAGAMPPAPMTTATVPFVRDAAEIKHVGLFSQLHHRRAAQRQGFGDVIFRDPISGLVSEGATWNLGLVAEDGTVVWPDAPVLPGVTALLLEQHTSVKMTTAPVHVDELPQFKAAFATNTSIGVRAISAIDEIVFDSDHPVLADLQKQYAAIDGEPIRADV